MMYAPQPAYTQPVYAPQPQMAPQPIMQGYAPQMTPKPRGNGWWKWALAAGLGGLGVGGVILGNRMEENDRELIKENKKRKWMPNFDMDPITMTSVLTTAPGLLKNVLKMGGSVRDSIRGFKDLHDAKTNADFNKNLATEYKQLQDSYDIQGLRKKLVDIIHDKQEEKVDPKLMAKIRDTVKQGHFSEIEDTPYHERYKDYQFNVMMPYGQSQVPQYTYPQQPMQSTYIYQQPQGYAAQPMQKRGGLGKLALGLSALAALGGGAYALKKANALNQEVADSAKPSFINKINVPDLIAPLIGVTGLIENNSGFIGRNKLAKAQAIKEDTQQDIQDILKHGKVGHRKRKIDEVKPMYEASDIAGQLANVAGIAMPFVKKFIQHKADEAEDSE